MRRVAAGVVSCALLGALGGSPLRAQEAPRTHAVELTLSAWYFQPTGTRGTTGGSSPLLLTRRSAPGGGLHLSFNPPSGWFAVNFSGGYAHEGVLQQGTGASGKQHTNLMVGTAKVMFGRSPRKPGVSYLVGGGLSVERRKKGVLDPGVGTTNVGASAGAMLRIPIDGQVGLRIDAEDLIYRADWGFGKMTRNDFVFSAGLSIAW